MTNAEAIEILRANYPDACFEQLRAAVDKAIKALEAQEQKERNCSTCKHKDLCAAFWTQGIEDAPCRDCDDLVYQKWESQELVNNSKKLDSENNEYLTTNLRPNLQLMHWIPCSERLPDEDYWLGGSGRQFSENVMVTIVNHSDEDAWVDTTYTIDGEWALELPRHCKITAWRNLPEPYKEGEGC